MIDWLIVAQHPDISNAYPGWEKLQQYHKTIEKWGRNVTTEAIIFDALEKYGELGRDKKIFSFL